MSATVPPSDAAELLPDTTPLGVRVLHVAWMSIFLGLVMEGVLIAVATIDGSASDGIRFLVDAMQKVSWSFLVCVGLAVGCGAASAVRPLVMGVIGLFAAPAAFTIARMLQNSAAQLLNAAVPPGMVSAPSVTWLAAIKAVEFACLGFAAGILSTKAWAHLRAHALLGLIVGLLFGGLMLAYIFTASDPKPATARLVGQGINEVIYPVGCAMILYAARMAGARLAKL